MVRKVAKCRVWPAETAGRIGPDDHRPETGRERLIDEELARQAFADTHDFLQDLERLEGAHDAGLRTGRGGSWRGRLGEQAAITGQATSPEGFVGRELAIKFRHSSGN